MTRRPGRRPAMISLVSLFVFLMLVVLLGLAWNTVRVTNRKLEVQTAADNGGESAGVQAGRAMNTVTAITHLIGELNALSTLCMAVFGIEYESGTTYDLSGPAASLASAFNDALAAKDAAVPPNATAFERARSLKSAHGGAIGDSRRQLMEKLADAFRAYAVASTKAARIAARQTQDDVEAEWIKIDAIARTAPQLLGLKQLCNHTLIPDLHAHCKRVVETYPARAEAAAAEIASRHGATGTLFPTARGTGRYPLELPVVSEKERVAKTGWARSQMVRATTPWVQYWRKPTLEYAVRELPLSGYAGHYLRHTQKFTLDLSRWQGADYETYLYVLPDGGGDKGREPWTTAEGSRLADRHFGLLGIAHMPAPRLMGAPVFRQSQPDGIVALTQVLVYNANPQEPDFAPPGRRANDWQRRVGWDTLNWDPAVAVPEFDYGAKPDRAKLVVEPRIQVNWRVKPVPISLADAAVGSQDESVDRILRQTAGAGWVSGTH